MTEISFHTHVPDVLGYACRLLRKGLRQGARLVVTADGATLGQLDRALWVFDPLAFVPHRRLAPGAEVPALLRDTPIWLLDAGAEAPSLDTLVNLGPGPAAGFESFARVIEIVGEDAEAAQAGRLRWRHYTERGYAIRHHRPAV